MAAVTTELLELTAKIARLIAVLPAECDKAYRRESGLTALPLFMGREGGFMIRTMTARLRPLLLLTLAVTTMSKAQLPVVEPQQDKAVTSITITPENVELDGAGSFDFEPESGAFDVTPPAGGDGLSLTVRVWFDALGKPTSCDIGSTSLSQAAQTACAQLVRSATFHMYPGMAMPLHRGFIDVRFSFFKDIPDAPLGLKMYAFAHPGYKNILINYPPDETPPDDHLRPADGNLAISISADDYPPIAMRYALESVSGVLLGISRNGQIKSCRPVNANGMRTAYLDNYTCDLFIKRGRFEFIVKYPTYSDLRYMTARMRWKLP